jgi:GNAT superfamily N-acetyltransferase
MKKEYNFRKAGEGDLEEFYILFNKLTVELFSEYSLNIRKNIVEKEWSYNAVKAQFNSGQINIYLAFSFDKLIGYLVARPIVGGVCLGEWMAIDKDYQKMGVASGFLSVWEKDAKKNGMHKLHLWADKRNVQFYKNRGFILVGKIPKNYYGVDDYFFYKSIQKPLEKNYLKKELK